MPKATIIATASKGQRSAPRAMRAGSPRPVSASAAGRKAISPTVMAKKTTPRHREHQGEAAQLDEATGLVFVVGAVDRLHQVLDTGGGRPQRQDRAHQHGEQCRALLAAGGRLELLLDHVLDLLGRRGQQVLHVLGGVGRIRDQAVDPGEGAEGGGQGQQEEEGDPRGEEGGPVGLGLLGRPGEDVEPAPRRHLGGSSCVSSPGVAVGHRGVRYPAPKPRRNPVFAPVPVGALAGGTPERPRRPHG